MALRYKAGMAALDLDRALLDLRAVRRQVAEGTEFRGYGPLTLYGSAVMAGAGGLLQWVLLPRGAAASPWTYVGLWLSVAVVCAAMIATEMLTRARRHHGGLADEMVRAAVLQFLPAGMAGVALPFLLLRVSPAACSLLPGLWQVIFSLGVFASGRSLPRATAGVAAWYLLAGCALIAAGPQRALEPVWMSVSFVLGMTAMALIYSRSERCEESGAYDEEA